MSDSGEVQASVRRGAQAASVSNRWWESESAGHPGAARTGPVPASPLWQAPPPPPRPEEGALGSQPAPLLAEEVSAAPRQALLPPSPGEQSAPLSRERHQLEQELEAARAEVAALHEMLEDLPEIFERKFRQRVQSLVEEQQRLLTDNQLLRDRLYALTPATPTANLPPASPGRALSSVSGFPSLGQRPRLRQTLRDALDSLRRPRGGQASADDLNGRDDGRTTAA